MITARSFDQLNALSKVDMSKNGTKKACIAPILVNP
jgi:hypothetical protein